MRVVRNTGYLKRRKRAGKLMVAAGLLLLLGSWVMTIFIPDVFFLAMVGLVFGFFFFNGGMQQVGRWSRNPRTDVVIDAELQRLNDRYTLFHYPDLPGRRPDHILIMPNGILVVTPRELIGRMRVDGKRWRKLESPFRRFFLLSTPQLGNPSVENEEQVEGLRKYLGEQSLPGGDQIEGVVVFVADQVEVEINEPTLPVLHVTELLDHVRAKGSEVTLDNRARDQLVAALSRGEQLETSSAAPERPKKKVRAV